MEGSNPRNQGQVKGTQGPEVTAGRMQSSLLTVSPESGGRGVTESWGLDQQASLTPSFTHSIHICQVGNRVAHVLAKLWCFSGGKKLPLMSTLG